MRALVAAALLLATATLMLVAVQYGARAGALAIGACGAFGEAFDFHTADEAAQKRAGQAAGAGLPGGDDREARLRGARGRLSASACGAHGWGKAARARQRAERRAEGLLPGRRQGLRDPHLHLRRQELSCRRSAKLLISQIYISLAGRWCFALNND